MTRILLGIIGVVAIGGGAYFYSAHVRETGNTSNTASSTQAVTSSDTTTTQQNFAEVVAQGNDIECTVVYATSTLHTQGHIYIADHGKKVHADFTTVDPRIGTHVMHIIRADDTNYMWGDAMPYAMKMKIAEEDRNKLLGSQSSTVPEDTQFSCIPWTVDESQFAVPTDQNFVDMQTRIDAMTQRSPEETKAMACALCAHAGANEAQCRAAYKCDTP